MLQRKIVDGKHCYQNGVGPLCFYTPGNKVSRDNAKSKAQFGSSPKTVANFFKHSKRKKTGSGNLQIWGIPSYSAWYSKPPANAKIYSGSLGSQHG